MNNSLKFKKTVYGFIKLSLFLFPFSTQSFAMQTETASDTKVLSLKLGASRIIYSQSSNGEILSLDNIQDYPILVQSKIFSEDMAPSKAFIVTPPLFRIDEGEKGRLRIIRAGERMPEDRESLNWLCVKSMPPDDNSNWSEQENAKARKTSAGIKLLINNCIKIFSRPDKLRGTSEESVKLLKWSTNGKSIIASNATPFYINLNEVLMNNTPMKDVKYIAPFSSRSFNASDLVGKINITWDAIDDYGGISQKHQAEIQI